MKWTVRTVWSRRSGVSCADCAEGTAWSGLSGVDGVQFEELIGWNELSGLQTLCWCFVHCSGMCEHIRSRLWGKEDPDVSAMRPERQ